jgi:hypothetical protein
MGNTGNVFAVQHQYPQNGHQSRSGLPSNAVLFSTQNTLRLNNVSALKVINGYGSTHSLTYGPSNSA